MSEFKPQLQELFKIKDERIAKLQREIEIMENNRDCLKFMHSFMRSFSHRHKC